MGKTKIPLPKSITELDKLAKEYLKALDSNDHHAETQKFQEYVEKAVKNADLEEEEYDSEDNNIDISDGECDNGH